MSLPAVDTNSAQPGGPHLTARELQVLEYAAHGLRNREIGEQLGISEQTVKNHMWNLLRKLSLPDRTRAVVVAIERGWIPVEMALDTPVPFRTTESPRY